MQVRVEEDLRDWLEYSEEGSKRALALGNRGPVKLDDNGNLDPLIIEAYQRTGFYVFTDVLSDEEIGELAFEFDALLDNAPTSRKGLHDKHGELVKFPGYYSLSYSSEDNPFDQKKTDENGSENLPTVGLLSHPLMMMDSAMRAYAHPKILSIAAGINGSDFVPFHEGIFHKAAGEGPATPWHQDGRTHWDNQGRSLEMDDGSGKTHGFNLSIACSECNPDNGLWVLPGSHRNWLLHQGGEFPAISTQIKGAVPVMMKPGDCAIVNRSSLHGSFPNYSKQRRITILFGFHKRDSAIGATTTNVHAFKVPGKTKQITYTNEYVLKRSRMIPLAINARAQKYPDEVGFNYQGSFKGSAEWNEQSRAEISAENQEYWQQDITL